MLVDPTRPFVDVRSGHREQLVIRDAPHAELYVLSAHAICLSAEHLPTGIQTMGSAAARLSCGTPSVRMVVAYQKPGAQSIHSVDLAESASLPAGHASQAVLPL
jgi:hypothetical protein